MGQSMVISPSVVEKFSQLADLLERAGKLARELEQSGKKAFQPRIPQLNRPKQVPQDQAWFWTSEWQAMERDANEDLARGSFTIFDTTEEMLTKLHARV